MKFEWDTARAILQAIEDSPHSRGNFDFLEVLVADEALHYHLRLLREGGFIEANEVFPHRATYPTCLVQSMTLAGHELLDVMRNDTMWGNIKSTVREKGLSLTFDTIKAAGLWLITRAFT